MYGAVVIGLAIGDYYYMEHKERAWLGFPTEIATADLLQEREPFSLGSGFQKFEGGAVYWRPGTKPIAVPNSTMELPGYDGIGFPVSEEEPMSLDRSGRIQFFEHGVVALRDGKREIWLRPESDT
jgi:uncharacterized protein with LGFP repeats